jgi:hypothetical protein
MRPLAHDDNASLEMSQDSNKFGSVFKKITEISISQANLFSKSKTSLVDADGLPPKNIVEKKQEKNMPVIQIENTDDAISDTMPSPRFLQKNTSSLGDDKGNGAKNYQQ